MKSIAAAFVMTLLLTTSVRAQPLDLKSYRLVDLTHPFNKHTIYWPTDRTGFQLKLLSHGETDAGYFYAANTFCTAEHGGTHLDAPLHFAAGQHSTEQIPLAQLVAPAVVIDVFRQAARDRDYRLSRKDVLEFEGRHGKIESGTIVLLRTRWGRYWPDRKAYLGDDTPGDVSGLSFPSYGEDAARLLVEQRRVAMLGVDTASMDYGRSRDFMVHRIAGASNVPGLENLANLDEVPPSGAWIIALPMKIQGGSGGPARVIALVPKD